MAVVDYDVIVVGAGPVGLTTALLLNQLGHRVRIYERHSRRYPQPRAVGIFHQGVRAFDALGVLDRMLESGALQNIQGHVNDLISYVDGEGQTLVQFPINMPVSKSGVAHSYAIHQPTMEADLEEACLERGVEISRSVQAVGVLDTGDCVEVTLKRSTESESDSSATNSKATAYFVVGCDGANSVVRESAGINFVPFEGGGGDSRWLVLDVIPLFPNSGHHWKDGDQSKQYLDPKRPKTSVPSLATRRRWEFMVMPNESSELATSDEFIWNLLSFFNCGPDTAEVERRVVYSIRGGWTESFAKGRIALAGDSAHLAPQFLAQGLNSGLRDAKSLAWRLDLAIRNATSTNWPILLKDYTSEQLGTTMQFVAAARGMEKLLTVTDPQQAKMRDVFIKTQTPQIPDLERLGGPGMHLREGDSKAPPCCEPGALFIQDKVEIDGKRGFFDNMVGEGWVLVSFEDQSDALTPETRSRYENFLGGLMVHFSGPGGYQDVSGRYARWFGDSGRSTVLVRPDYYIYGSAKNKQGVEALVKSALDHLTV